MTGFLSLLFVLSGAAGLIYESTWARYLGLFVGHTAYAQIVVLVIFLGGMSLGAAAVGRWSERLKEPLWGYVACEFLVGCLGLFFHEIYQSVTAWAYSSVYPSLAGSWTLIAAKWAIAGGLILPQSVLLGMTFPLMSAGILRLTRGRPGRTLSVLYFANSLGAAIGVLAAGFCLVELVGLPGTIVAAVILNLVVAASTCFVLMSRPRRTAPGSASRKESGTSRRAAVSVGRVLVAASFGTAIASFIYEIAWIRMLALVLGSATHSFELMLSAFILGLALGAWWIRSRADHLEDPLRTLGLVQCAMGMLAIATLPLYALSFEWIASLLSTFSRTDSGYIGFTIARYGLCLLIMLPATFCAGMTLPLITRILMGGMGEGAIGAVYAWNTLGSIAGVVLGGLVLLPVIGLKGMLVAGAVLDIAIGVLLLSRPQAGKERRRLTLSMAAVSLVAVALIGGAVRLDKALLSSGVYRTGSTTGPEKREVTFYEDGRTATVTGSRLMPSGRISLATNGKADASLTPDWFSSCDSVGTRLPLAADAGTQALLPLVTLAHAPGAQTAAVIGQGSGMSSHHLLSSPGLRELVTIEIEPQMIEGSRVFYPANRRVFDDPRSHIVIDDAKSYFASERRKFDLIMSEPSNPWVSGVSGLFTTEFYARVKEYLTPDGVFGQWLQLYELDDELVLSVLVALQENFRSYELYQVGRGDLLVVAGNRARLSAPDWGVFQSPALERDLCRFVPLTPEVLDGLHLAGKRELGPLLQSSSQPNSDFFPVLDLGAEKRRFRRDFAGGFPVLSSDWFNLVASQRGRRTASATAVNFAFPENPRVRARAVGALLRQPASTHTDTAFGQMSRDALFRWRQWQGALTSHRPPANWQLWLDQASAMEKITSGGTAGVADEGFYRGLRLVMDRHAAPPPVRDVVAFRHALATWKFSEASQAGERLVPLIVARGGWMPADELRDGLIMARLHIKDVKGARRAYDALTPLSTRPEADLRSRLLASYLRMAEWMRASVVRRPAKATPVTP